MGVRNRFLVFTNLSSHNRPLLLPVRNLVLSQIRLRRQRPFGRRTRIRIEEVDRVREPVHQLRLRPLGVVGTLHRLRLVAPSFLPSADTRECPSPPPPSPARGPPSSPPFRFCARASAWSARRSRRAARSRRGKTRPAVERERVAHGVEAVEGVEHGRQRGGGDGVAGGEVGGDGDGLVGGERGVGVLGGGLGRGREGRRGRVWGVRRGLLR